MIEQPADLTAPEQNVPRLGDIPWAIRHTSDYLTTRVGEDQQSFTVAYSTVGLFLDLIGMHELSKQVYEAGRKAEETGNAI
jgi:hypothetical protein